MKQLPTINEIDFAELYRNQVKLSNRIAKKAEDWDKRAISIAQNCGQITSEYTKTFTSRMDLSNAETLLDVGCGPGTICLALAKQLKQVYGLDYSQEMLNILQTRAEQMQLTNVQSLYKSWDDNWDDVPECDICVSSRSSMVDNIEVALNKLNAKAKKAVYMTISAGNNFVIPDILRFLQRDTTSFPDYIYAVNILYQQGYLVNVSFITLPHEGSKAFTNDLQGFIDSVRWSIGNITDEETEKLKYYFTKHQDPHLSALAKEKTWALLSWSKR